MSESKIKVECYAGYKAEQRPTRFTLRGETLEVVELQDQWYSPACRYFRLRANDGNTYILCYHEEKDCWSLEAFRKTALT